MKKHFLKSFALLAMLFSALTLSAQSGVDWSTIAWIGNGSGDATYTDKYKCSTTEGLDVIQFPGFATEVGIYMTFPAADINCNISGYDVQGAGIIMHLSSFTAQETEVTVTYAGGSRTFWIYYADGTTGESGGDEGGEGEEEGGETSMWDAIDWITGSDNLYKISSDCISNNGTVEAPAWANNVKGIYITVPSGISSTSIEDAVIMGAGVLLPLTAFTHQETEVTITHALGECTLLVYYANGLNWDNEDWIIGSDNKYKIISECISNNGTVEAPAWANNVKGIYVTVPSGISSTSIEDAVIMGAGVLLPLTAFTHQETEVTITHALGECTLLVYYSDGIPGVDSGEGGEEPDPTPEPEPEVVESNYCQTPLTSGTNTIYLTCEKVSDGNYRMTVEGENVTGFGGSFYNPGGKDLRDATITSQTSTKIVCDIAAESAPVFYTPLYVNMPGEVNFGTIDNIVWGTCPEPEVSVLTTLTATAASSICKVGETVAITIVAKDQYGITMDAGTVEYTISPADAGTIVDNVFTPTKAGLATITASVGSVQATAIEIFAYEDGANLALSTNINTDNKVIAQSDFAPSGTDAWNAVDGNEGSVWQGSATNGGAGDDAARTYDSWFVIDLGAHYNLNLVTITFEGACSQNYTVAVSSDYINWNTAYTHNGSAGVNGRTDNLFGNNLNNATNVRFVRFWSTKAATQWGVKVFEFKVYGTKVADKVVGTNNPAMQSATLKSSTPTSATITLSATDADNTGIVKYHVKDEANGLDKIVTSLTNDFLIKGLKDNTTYTLVVAAIDVDGNESAPFTMESFTTAADPTKPTTSAPVPTRDEEDVLSFYSDAYTPVINLGWTNAWTNALYTEETIEGDKYLHYSDKQDWGWEFGVKEGYTDGVNTGVDCSAMEFLHVDVWGYEAGTIRVIPIYGGANLTSNERYYAEIEVKAGQWNSVDVALTDFIGSGDKHDFTSIHQFKFSNRSMIVAIDNVYFWKSAGTLPVESVTLDKTTATIEVEEVLQLNATVLPIEAGNKNVIWTSSDETVATVVDGNITGLKEGTTTITATSKENSEIKATCEITVEPITVKTWWGEPTTIKIEGVDVAILYSYTRNVDKTITYSVIFDNAASALRNDINVNLGDYNIMHDDGTGNNTAIWTSTTTHSKGETITGFWYIAGNRIDFSYIVGSSNERPNTAVTSVTLDKTSCDLLVDETVQLLATVNPGIAANKNVTWNSSNSAVAEVDANGLVTAKSAGNATITVTTADGGKTATCIVNVVDALTDATFYASGWFKENVYNNVGINYSITRTADRKLRYDVKINSNVGKLDLNVVDLEWHVMEHDAATNTYTYTTTNTYTDGEVISVFLRHGFAGGEGRWDFNYTVGSTNSPVRTMVGINDQEDNQSTRLAQYTSPVDVVLARAITPDDDWFSISLPFALNATQITEIFGDGTQVLKLAKAGVAPDQVTELGFSPVNAIQAATPYLIKPTKKVNAGTVLRNITLATTSNPVKVSNVTMHPLLNQIEYDYTNDDVLFFLGTDNLLYYQATDNKLLGLRAYFTFDGVTTYSQAAQVRARVVFNENETTDLDNLITTDAPVKVIENGQLIIIRDGIKYNVQGQVIR